MDWIPTQPPLDNPITKESWQQVLIGCWDRFKEKIADRIPTQLEEAYHMYVKNLDVIRRRSLIPPLTLCHGDYRLDNIFFGNPRGSAPPVVIDWQTLTRGQGALDLSLFLIWNLEPELRRKVEKDLLQKYCAELKEHGVKEYSPEQCFHSYRISLYDFVLMRVVDGGATLDLSNDRAKALIFTLLARTSEAIIDHPIVDLI